LGVLVFVGTADSDTHVVAVVIDETPPNVPGVVCWAAENGVDFLAV
jgi:hypothetical protein